MAQMKPDSLAPRNTRFMKTGEAGTLFQDAALYWVSIVTGHAEPQGGVELVLFPIPEEGSLCFLLESHGFKQFKPVLQYVQGRTFEEGDSVGIQGYLALFILNQLSVYKITAKAIFNATWLMQLLVELAKKLDHLTILTEFCVFDIVVSVVQTYAGHKKSSWNKIIELGIVEGACKTLESGVFHKKGWDKSSILDGSKEDFSQDHWAYYVDYAQVLNLGLSVLDTSVAKQVGRLIKPHMKRIFRQLPKKLSQYNTKYVYLTMSNTRDMISMDKSAAMLINKRQFSQFGKSWGKKQKLFSHFLGNDSIATVYQGLRCTLFCRECRHELKRHIHTKSCRHTVKKALQFIKCCAKGCVKNSDTCKMLFCSQCMSVSYCSAECQTADWKGHKKVCKKLKKYVGE